MGKSEKFAIIKGATRIWAVGSIHGEVERLSDLHRQLVPKLSTGDRVLYLGNFLGIGNAIRETVEELLRFRLQFLARHGACTPDIVYLRGCQEEMWQKLLQIHLALNPAEVLGWMFEQGAAATLAAYGGRPETGLAAVREGAMALNKWAAEVRDRIRAADGHNALMASLRRAAYTSESGLLFVHAGLDPSRLLTEQKDNFWWGNNAFDDMTAPYQQFGKVIRGFDPKHRGVAVGETTMTVDGGCGFGGFLVAACLDSDGTVLETIEA